MKTDEELIIDFRQGNTAAFNTLVDRYTPRLYSFLGGTSDTMDLVQDTFNKVYRNIHQFNTDKSFKTWLFSIARNCSIDAGRKAGRRFPLLNAETANIEESHDDCPASSMSRTENKEIVKEALNQLPEKQREVLILSYYQNLSYPQIAKKMSCSTSTVKTHMARAVRKLMHILPDHGGLF